MPQTTTKDPGRFFLQDGVEGWTDEVLEAFYGQDIEPWWDRTYMETLIQLMMVTLIRGKVNEKFTQRCEYLGVDAEEVRFSSSPACQRVLGVASEFYTRGTEKYFRKPPSALELLREEHPDQKEARLRFDAADVDEKRRLDRLGKARRTTLRQRYERRVRLFYLCFLDDDDPAVDELTLQDEVPFRPSQDFLTGCLEAIRLGGDELVLELVLGGYWLWHCDDDGTLDQLAAVVYEFDDDSEAIINAVERVLHAHVDLDGEDGRCRRFIAACKRRMLGTYEDRIEKGHVPKRWSGALYECFRNVVEAEMSTVWLDSHYTKLFHATPPERRRLQRYGDRESPYTRLDTCAHCQKKRSATHKLLTCAQCRDVAFCDVNCQRRALKAKTHRKHCANPFRPKPSLFRHAVVDLVVTALAVSAYLVDKGIWKPYGGGDDDSDEETASDDDDGVYRRRFSTIQRFQSCVMFTLFDLRPVEAHNVVARAFELKAIDDWDSGDYHAWVHRCSIPVIPMDENIKNRVPVMPGESDAEIQQKMEQKGHDLRREFEQTLDNVVRKALNKLILPIKDAATGFTNDLYAAIDRHYGRPNSIGPIPSTAEPLLSLGDHHFKSFLDEYPQIPEP